MPIVANPKSKANAKRQASYRARLRAKGLCLRCRAKVGRKKVEGQSKCLCVKCTLDRRKYQRKLTGSKPWKKGGRGRPPIVKIAKTKRKVASKL